MARNVNVVVLTGNLTRDPELRTTPSGTSVCSLGLAVNESYKDNTDQWIERANFFDITVWGRQGDACAQYLAKGRPVAVHGRLRYESWEKDGQKRSKVTVVADMVQFLGGGDGSGGGGRGQDELAPGEGADPYGTGGRSTEGGDFPASPTDDDIPFKWTDRFDTEASGVVGWLDGTDRATTYVRVR